MVALSYGLDTQRLTFYVRPNPQPDRWWSETLHADLACACFRGSRASIWENSELGETLLEAARRCANRQVNPTRLCPRRLAGRARA